MATELGIVRADRSFVHNGVTYGCLVLQEGLTFVTYAGHMTTPLVRRPPIDADDVETLLREGGFEGLMDLAEEELRSMT